MKRLLAVLLCILGGSLINGQFFRPQTTRCINPNERPGTCVSIYDCQTVMSVLQRATMQPIDQEFVKASECTGGYGRGPHVCCTSDTGFVRFESAPTQFNEVDSWNFQPQRNGVPFTAPNFNYRQPTGSFFPEPQQRRRAIESTTSLLPQPPTCGGVTIGNKIYGGTDADLYEFPWMVLFEYNRNAGGLSVNCAGSLINQRYVLTAAHCVTGAIIKQVGQLISIRLGEHDVTSQVDCNQVSCAPEALRVGVDSVIPHELYEDSSSNKMHDIALVRLDRNIRYSDSTRPICLPSAVSQGQLTTGTKLTVAGWGRTLRSAKSAIKQKLDVSLVDQQQCQRKFRNRGVNVMETQLCAGGIFAQDSCEGDSGGPLMRFRGGAWVLEGIVSFGVKCGLRDWPAVYTRVQSYEDWIRSKIST